MDQSEFLRHVGSQLNQYAWFLGAGASQSAGLPTAWDIIWDLKRRYYATEENQRVPPNDMQNVAVREKIQSYMLSRGFPDVGAPEEYTEYFKLIFGDNFERQRLYISAMLAEKKVSLSIGHRVLAALMCTNLCRAVFTTNFDSVLEKAFAEVGERSLAAFHLEGTYAVTDAINSEQYPIYCKLHGDFRYRSLKNLEADLKTQDAALGQGLVNACNRFGLIVAGYSGRDASVMDLLHSVLKTNNPFPHGIFWTKLKTGDPLPAVKDFLSAARDRGVTAELVDIETFDSMMSRIWRQIPDADPAIDAKVRKASKQEVKIPIPQTGRGSPILRASAIPIVQLPEKCLELKFKSSKEWKDLRDAEQAAEGKIICTKGAGETWAWGSQDDLKEAFPDLENATPVDMRNRIENLDTNHFLKEFLEKALSASIVRDKSLILRSWRKGWVLIADGHAIDIGQLQPLTDIVGKLHGDVPGLFTKPSDDHPISQKVSWAECVQVSLEVRNGKYWLLLRPDVWIWPKRSREDATEFLDRRRGNRFNKQADQILSAWVKILFPSEARAENITLSPFDTAPGNENPTFVLNSRTAFSRRSGT